MNAALTEAILNHLATRRAHVPTGNRDNEESLTFLVSTLRDKGWRNFGNTLDFADDCKAAGFTVRQVRVGRGTVRTYVGL